MFCPNCGKEVNDKAVVCIGCGCELKESKVKKSSSIGIWGVLGCIFIPLFGLVSGIIFISKGYTRTGVKCIGIRVITYCFFIFIAILVPEILSHI